MKFINLLLLLNKKVNLKLMGKSIIFQENKLFHLFDKLNLFYQLFKKLVFDKITNKLKTYNDKQRENNKKQISIYKRIQISSQIKFIRIQFEIFFLIFLIQTSFSSQAILNFRNLSSVSEITVTIIGEGEQYILNNKTTEINKINYNFNQIPDEILINGVRQNYTGIVVYNLKGEENIITMRFNEPLTDCNVMFYNLNNIIKIDLSKFDTSEVTTMIGMFNECTSLISLNLDGINTSLVKNLDYMFSNCTMLDSINLESFDTKSVKSMAGIFSYCKSLKSIDLKNFETSSLENMAVMFLNCSSIKTLELNNFDTKSVTNFHGLFKHCSSLISLDISSFQTFSSKNMNEMFNGCTSLISLNLINFSTKSIDKIYDMFLNFNPEAIFYVDEDKIPKIAGQIKKINKNYKNDGSNICFTNDNKKLIPEKNMCIADCFEDKQFMLEYNNLCYEICPNNTHISFSNNHSCENNIYDSDSYLNDILSNTKYPETNKLDIISSDIDDKENKEELIPNWDPNSFFNGSSKINDANVTIKDEIKKTIEKDIINGKINITKLTKGDKNDLIVKSNDTIYQITSSDNQDNNDYNDISTIQLGECEKILREIYHIDDNLSLIIFKIDYFLPGISIPVIGYDIFHPENRSKLNLSYCKDSIVNFQLPVNMKNDELFKYDPNNEYYTDECFPYTTENGTDIILNDRHDEYNTNNFSLCENNCSFTGFDENTKKVKCDCHIKSKEFVISKLVNDKNILSNYDFNDKNSSNFVSMKCFYTLFSKEGISNNIGNYILLAIIVIFAILLILFYKVGYELLMQEINRIVEEGQNIEKKNKLKKDIININNIYNGNKTKKKERIKNIRKSEKLVIRHNKKKIPKKKENNQTDNKLVSNPNLKGSKKDLPKTAKKKIVKKVKIKTKKQNNDNNQTDVVSIYNNIKSSKIDLINFKRREKKSISMKNDPITIENTQIHEIYNDYELFSFSYRNALIYDKRTFFKYYISLIRTKHPIIFSFIPMNDYNSILIKISLFLLFFAITYTINALFFTEQKIHKIYENGGIYNYNLFLPQIIWSFILSHLLYNILRAVSLSEKNIVDIKNNVQNDSKVKQIRKCIEFKYIFFYVIGLIFLFFFWYYLSSFCAVFKNSQIYLIKNTLLSLTFSLFYPFFINIFPCTFRLISLKDSNKSKECLYKTSKIIHIIL